MNDERVRMLAASQHGLVRLDQLRQLGVHAAARRHRVATGAFEQLGIGVFRIAGSAPTIQQRRLAAVFDAGSGAVLSHDSAAEAWGMPRRRTGGLQVARARRSTPRASHLAETVHVLRDLAPHHAVRRHGVPTATPARVVVDMAATAHPLLVARSLDSAWSRRLLNIGQVATIVAEVRCKGRRGVVLLDELIAERKFHPRPGSALELKFENALQRYGLPAMRPQVHLHDEEGWIGCVDYVAVDVPVVVFVDGAAFHTSLTDCRHDDMQTKRIEAIGYDVQRVSDADVLYREAAMAERLRPLLLVRDRAA